MKRGTFFIGAGILLLAASLGLGMYNLRAERFAASATVQVYTQLQLPRVEAEKPVSDLPEIPDYIIDPGMEMPTTEIDGRSYIGTLEIPSLSLSLPITSQWSYDALRTAPGRYCGSVYSHDLVIAAHNYAAHFGRLRDLPQGAPLTFTDVDGNVFTYEVLGLEILNPTDIAYMTTGEWDMTLFTCTPGGAQRVTIRCALRDAKPNRVTAA